MNHKPEYAYNYKELEQRYIRQCMKVASYEKVLKIYADERGYVDSIGGVPIEPTIMEDQGDMAREVLEKWNVPLKKKG